MRTILNTLRIILSIRNTININVILHGIRSIPLIGKHIPEDIYAIRPVKIIVLIFSVFGEILRAFFLKLMLFVVLFFASLAISSMNLFSQRSIFLYGFVAISIMSMFWYDCFHVSTDTEYAVFMMGMDAKEYVKAIAFYNAFNTVIGYTFFAIPTAILAGVPWYIALLMPVSGVGIRAITLGVEMAMYSLRVEGGKKTLKRNGRPISIEGNMILNILIICTVFVGSLFLMFIVLNDNFFWILVGLIALPVLLLIPGLLLIKKFPYNLYRSALFAEKVIGEIYKEQSKKEVYGKRDIKVNMSTSVDSKYSGYAFLNELFFKRHKKILWGREIWNVIVVAAFIILSSILLCYEINNMEDLSKSVVRFLIAGHPTIYIFILMIINSGEYACRAMYANCDSSMLKFSFYRTRESIAKMYRLRLISIFKLNLIPALMLAVYNVVVLALTGWESYFGQCILNIFLILIFTLYFCVRHTTYYYILQPYNADLKLKSKVYATLNFFLGMIGFIVAIIPIPAWVLAIAALVIIIPYMLIAYMLVKNWGPKTFIIK